MASFGYIITAIFLFIRVIITVGLIYLIIHEIRRLRRKKEDEQDSKSGIRHRSGSPKNN